MTFFALLAVSGHAVYQVYGEPGVTNWDIFYNVNTYLLFCAVFYEQAEHFKHNKTWRFFLRFIMFFYTYSMLAELRCINMEFSQYKATMYGDSWIDVVGLILLASVLVGGMDIIKKYVR